MKQFTFLSPLYKILFSNTEALHSYLGLSALSKNFFVCIKFDKGGNSLPKHFECTANIR